MHFTTETGARLAMARERNIAPVTIDDALARFLSIEQDGRSERAYRRVEDVIGLLADCLNGYGYLELDREDAARFNLYYNAKGSAQREFCAIFGPSYILPSIEEFLGRFLIAKVIGPKRILADAGPTVARLVEWLAAEGLVERMDAAQAAALARVLGSDVEIASDVGQRLAALADEAEAAGGAKSCEDAFRVSVILTDKIYLDSETTGEEYGPIKVPEDVASRLQIGWTFWASLASHADGWRLREVGCVYPERS